MSSDMSTQSQEAISAIDAELNSIFSNKDSKNDEDPGTDTEVTDTEIDGEEKPMDKVESEENRGQKRRRETQPRRDTEKSVKAKSFHVYAPTSEQKEAAGTEEKQPTMQRTRSLEVINRHKPAEIIRVCLDKTNQILQGGQKDYKKIKYWLKIAQSVSTSVERAKEFYTFIKNLRSQYSWDTELKEMLDSTFPSEVASS